MAGPMDKSKLQGLLLQAKLAAVTAHEIRDRMLQLQVRLQAQTTTNSTTTTTPAGAGAARPPSQDVTSTTPTATSSGGTGADVTDTTTTSPGYTGEARTFEDENDSGLHDSYLGLDMVAQYMTTCVTMAASNGVPPSLPIRFSVISDEQLYEEMLAMRLPESPTTQRHAFARLEAAFYSVKLPQEHHIERCAHHLRRPRQRGMHQARTYLGRACTSASLTVTALESFVDPKDVAEISDFATRTATRHLSHLFR